MSEPIARESPLARFGLAARAAMASGDAGIFVHERAFLGHLNLRGNPGDPRFVAAVQRVIGVAPPIVPNTVAEPPYITAYWLGPDEWLLVMAGESRAAIEGELRAALAGVHAAVTDVSGGQTVVVIRGGPVRELLAKGCPLDLHPRALAISQCAQSHLAKAPVLIRPLGGEPSFEIVVRRSFAEYFWTWLEDAAAEHGIAVNA